MAASSSRRPKRPKTEPLPSLPFLHADCIAEVCKRLPAKSLVRFEFVHSSWQEIIRSHYLVSAHFERTVSVAAGGNPKYLMLADFPGSDSDSPSLRRAVFLQFGNRGPRVERILEADRRTHIVGSSGGLCLTTDTEFWGLLSIWNPATGSLKPLPEQSPDYPSMCAGFGFLPASREYKVVRFMNYPFRVELMTLTKDHTQGWRELQLPQQRFEPSFEHGTLCGEYIYWHARVEDQVHGSIVSVNLANEEIELLPSPPPLDADERLGGFWKLGVYEGSLCFDSSHPGTVWLMERLGGHDIFWRHMPNLGGIPRSYLFYDSIRHPELIRTQLGRSHLVAYEPIEHGIYSCCRNWI